MNNFKRIFAVIMILSVVLALAACAGNPGASTPKQTEPTSTGTKPTDPKPTDPKPTDPKPTEPQYTYRVRVVDENGNPVVGAIVQICLQSCTFKPTNAEGYALFINDVEDGYKAEILDAPEGYYYSTEVTYFEPGQTEMTLTVSTTPLDAPESGAEG